MKEKVKNHGTALYFGMAAAFIAPFFLFNPDYTLLDFLPDCFGYLLLWVSLYRLRDLNSYFDTAADRFLKLALVSFLKFISFFVCLAAFDSHERPTMMLFLLFAFAIGELLLIFPGFTAYFDGFDFAGFIYPDKRSSSLKSYTSTVKSATLFFFVFKEAVTILPEFSVLAEHEYIDSGVQWNEFTGLFRTVAVMAIAVAGIIWLVRIVRFMHFTRKNTEAFVSAGLAYDKIISSRPGIFSRRHVSLLVSLVTAAVLLTCDIYIDGADVIPGMFSAALFLLFFLLSRNYIPHRRAGIVLSSLHLAISVPSWILSKNFRENYSFSRIHKDPKVFAAFWKYYPFKIAEAVIIIVLTVFVTKALYRLILDHCGYIPDTMDPDFRERKLREIRRGLCTRLGLATSAFVFTMLCSGASDFITSFYGYVWTDGWWIICAILTVGCSALYAYLAAGIKLEASSRYMLS